MRKLQELMNRRKPRHLALWLVLSMLVLPRAGLAWLFPEHTDIMAAAIEGLDPAQRAQFDKLWSEARRAHEERLCADPIAQASSRTRPTCVAFASWPAIAGDHSCSADDMLNTVVEAPWILQVERISATLKEQLAAAKRRDQQVNAVRDSNLALQRADQDLVTRATNNDAHFLLARPKVDTQPDEYGKLVLGAGAQLNALGAYAWYHLRALEAAEHMSRSDLAPDARAQAALAVLANEAFAVHFLQDAFASGHVAGSWGNTAVRLGTHDYYNEYGIEAITWKGEHYVALGDGYLRPEDEKRASAAVLDSLEQVLSTLEGKPPKGFVPATGGSVKPDAFNVCTETHFPTAVGAPENLEVVVPIIVQTPVAGLASGKGELPRFRAEIGPFIGVSSAVAAQGDRNGFGTNQETATGVGSLEIALRGGFGLDGVMSESGDGLVFAEVGLRYDSSSKLNGSSNALGSATATFPARQALTLRFRCPFWVIPGDLILAAPVLAFTSPKTLQKMAVEAGNGGLIPYQSKIATPVGSLQFMLGREIGISFYGYRNTDIFILPTPGVPPANATSVDLRSIQWDFPFLEYRPFRSFSTDQSSSLLIQLYFGVDVPTGWTVVAPPGAPKPETQSAWVGGLRIVFDWRHYF